MRRSCFAIAILLAAAVGPPAGATSPGGCEDFAWPLATELTWLRATGVTEVKSSDTLTDPPAQAIALNLLPSATVTLAGEPSGTLKGDAGATYAGLIHIGAASSPGLHQVTLSHKAWVDVVQNGKTIASVAHTGKTDCEAARKSVRFEIGPGPFTVQVTGASSPAIKVTIRKAN